jgi:hypothetical protein
MWLATVLLVLPTNSSSGNNNTGYMRCEMSWALFHLQQTY